MRNEARHVHEQVGSPFTDISFYKCGKSYIRLERVEAVYLRPPMTEGQTADPFKRAVRPLMQIISNCSPSYYYGT